VLARRVMIEILLASFAKVRMLVCMDLIAFDFLCLICFLSYRKRYSRAQKRYYVLLKFARGFMAQ
jgi:hypothetical protein